MVTLENIYKKKKIYTKNVSINLIVKISRQLGNHIDGQNLRIMKVAFLKLEAF